MAIRSILKWIFGDDDIRKENLEKRNVRCPFYGTSFTLPMMWAYDILYSPTMPVDPDSIQCAIMIETYGPCYMIGTEGGSPDWELCPRNHWNKGN